MNQEQKDELFRKVSSDIAETLVRKNHDYGDSFHKVYEQFGDVSTYIRLSDKLGRLANLVKNVDMRVSDESIEDAYRDIAGYCILTLASRMRMEMEKIDYSVEYKEDAIDMRLLERPSGFNIIEAIENKYGIIPADDLPGKIDWVKANLSMVEVSSGYESNSDGESGVECNPIHCERNCHRCTTPGIMD